MNQNYAIYQTTNVNTSNPMKLILMLYDGAIVFLKKSIEYAEKADIKNKNIYANRGRDIIIELNNSLNMSVGGEIAQNLRKLYLFMNRHLIRANVHNETQCLQDVVRLLSTLREAWEDAYNQLRTQDQKPYLQIANMRA